MVRRHEFLRGSNHRRDAWIRPEAVVQQGRDQDGQWYDEYDHLDLGKAIGPYRVTTIGSVNVYWREFERGYVYVNHPNDVASVILPQAPRQLTRDNMTATTSI
jgi:hypothetical protein